MKTIDDLLRLMKSLRDPDCGCPWDIRQTNASIASYTLEETHETLDAIERGDMQNLREELGDLLFHVVFHARIAEEAGEFNFHDVVETIVNKMTRRHPHVFGDQKHLDLQESDIRELWQSIKKQEKADVPETDFGDDSRGMSTIHRAQKLQQQAAKYGFDWPDINPVLDKLQEEIEELRVSIEAGDVNNIEDELGDVLFVCANIARHNRLDAETALRSTNQKFIRRFKYVKDAMSRANITMNPQQLEKMESFWQESKSIVG